MRILSSIFVSAILISFCNLHIISCSTNSREDIIQASDAKIGGISVPLISDQFVNNTFYANLEVGTPSDTYAFLFSLNSVNTSLFTNIGDKGDNPTEKCPTCKVFDLKKSSTAENKSIAVLNGNTPIGYLGTEEIGLKKDSTMLEADLVFRVNSTMDYSLTGLVSLSPKSSFLQLLLKNSIIDEEAFMYKTSGENPKRISEIILGAKPQGVENIPWLSIGNSAKWQLRTFYVAMDGVKTQECQERNGVALFNESNNIVLNSDTLSKLTTNLTTKKNKDGFFYPCDPADIKEYPVITIYTEGYSLNITADAYLDFRGSKSIDNHQYCPLAVESMTDSESCITLGYNYFVDNQVIFSKTKNSIGLLEKKNLKKMTMIGETKISELVGLFGMALAIGFAILRHSQREDELKKEINEAPGDVRSYSFYEDAERDT